MQQIFSFDTYKTYHIPVYVAFWLMQKPIKKTETKRKEDFVFFFIVKHILTSNT